MSNSAAPKEPAPTAEEQLPPLDVATVSEAMKDPYDTNAPWAKVARIRAIVEGK